MKHLLLIATLFALLTPAPAQTLEEIRQETHAVAAELTKLREVAAAKTKLELLKRALSDTRKGKVSKAAPAWPPAIKVGEVVVVKRAGVWWFVERRSGQGLYSLHEYGKGSDAKHQAEKFAAAVRKDKKHARLK